MLYQDASNSPTKKRRTGDKTNPESSPEEAASANPKPKEPKSDAAAAIAAAISATAGGAGKSNVDKWGDE